MNLPLPSPAPGFFFKASLVSLWRYLDVAAILPWVVSHYLVIDLTVEAFRPPNEMAFIHLSADLSLCGCPIK